MDNEHKESTAFESDREGETLAGSRRSFMVNTGLAAGGIAALGAGLGAAPAAGASADTGSTAVKKEIDGKMTTTISLDWKEVYHTNCPLISASNVDQELGWTAEEFGKIGVHFAYFRSRPETDWYPHYIHNQENLIRFGGLFPPIHVHADYRRTRMLGLTHVPYEGGCLMVRADDNLFRICLLYTSDAADDL